MVSKSQLNAETEAIINHNVVETAKIISRSLAFRALLEKQPSDVVECVMNISFMENNLHEKVKLFLYALDFSKQQSPEFFMTTCINVAYSINALADHNTKLAYKIIAMAGQKEFESIVNAAGVATKTGKKTTRPYNRKVSSPVTQRTVRDYNVWIDPDSSSIAKYMYCPESRILHVQFHSGARVYSYYDVSPVLFRDLQDAKSRGSFFATHIKEQKSANYR